MKVRKTKYLGYFLGALVLGGSLLAGTLAQRLITNPDTLQSEVFGSEDVGTMAKPGPVNGTTLTDATKTANAHWYNIFTWTLEKTVNPESLDMFKGDSKDVEYTVTVTKDGGTNAYWVDGEICFTNGGALATENLAITDNLYLKPQGPGGDILNNTIQVDVSGNPVLDPGETACYPYTIEILNPIPGRTYKDTASITITNHSNHLGEPFGPSPSATSVLASSSTPINDSITVEDTNGESWQFNSSGSETYSKTFSCDADEGENQNTVSTTVQVNDNLQLVDQELSDSANVTVNCYDLNVSKTANTSLDRTYNWVISKLASPDTLTLALNQIFPVNYTVTVNTTGTTDSNWKVEGTITVNNPAPMTATLNSVSDMVSPDIAAVVDCGVEFPYELAAGGDLVCNYSADLPNGTERTNTATATLQNTPEGTTDFTGDANVSFADPEVTLLDQCIDVSDSLQGYLGHVCVNSDTLPKSFNYSRNIGPYTSSGTYTVDNTASFLAEDTGAEGSATETVTVTVPAGGCTLTIGYYKTHAGFGPQADMVTPLLPKWLGTAFGAKAQNVTSAQLAVQFLSFMGSNNIFDSANGINKLYAQLLAAKFNIASGASDATVAATITAADAFLATKNSLDWAGLSKSVKNKVLGWMIVLDNFNNGLNGPGHCSF